LVDAGEAEVGDLVELAEALEHGDADLLAADLAPPGPDGLLELGAQLLHLLDGDGAVLRGRLHARDDLVPPERLPRAGALHDHEGRLFETFEGGEPPPAGQALPPPA